MKKISKCKKCGNTYDGYLPSCPICLTNNDTSPLDKKFSRMIFLTDYKEFLLFVIGFLGLIVFAFLMNLGLQNFVKQENLLPTLTYFFAYMLVIAVMLCVVAHDFRRILSRIKQFRPIIAGLIGGASIIAFSLIYSAILNAANVHISSSDNQLIIEKIVKAYPALAFFFIVIFGPVAEEFAYRLGAFSFLRKRNRYLAYIVTIIIFTLIHFSFTSKNLVNECINLPVYIFPAFVLCVIYEYEGLNACIYAHVLNNLVSFIMVLASK